MLDFPNERYVRLYTRETAEMVGWSWEARAVFPWLLAHADRSGVIQVRAGPRRWRLLAGLLKLPFNVVRPGLIDLLEDGVTEEHEVGFLLPNFLEAQEAVQSPAQRTREWRQRRLDQARNAVWLQRVGSIRLPAESRNGDVSSRNGAQVRDAASRVRDVSSPAETKRLQNVTPYRTEPCLRKEIGRGAQSSRTPPKQSPPTGPNSNRGRASSSSSGGERKKESGHDVNGHAGERAAFADAVWARIRELRMERGLGCAKSATEDFVEFAWVKREEFPTSGDPVELHALAYLAFLEEEDFAENRWAHRVWMKATVSNQRFEKALENELVAALG